MKIVYDNIIYSLQRYGGISVVWSNLLSRMHDFDNDVTAIEYNNALTNISRKNISLKGMNIINLSPSLLKIKRYFDLPCSIVGKVDKSFIFHSSYYRTLSHPKAINITTVHDFAYEYFVKNPLIRFLHCYQKHRAIRRSQHVVCISENTRRDLLKLLPDVSPDKVSVIYNGVDCKFHPIPRKTTEEYVLYVGNRDRYKNFDALIQPLSELGVKLKIVGKTLSKEEYKRLDDSNLSYEYCGMVSDEKLNELYSDAFCLLYTSQYEGFGLPVLEAQMAGCPVIAFNASSIPEVIGDKRLLVDEISANSFSEKFSLLRDTKERTLIIDAGIANAARFSWDKMAQEYKALYNRLLSSSL